jgi:nitric oxide dioxygenase
MTNWKQLSEGQKKGFEPIRFLKKFVTLGQIKQGGAMGLSPESVACIKETSHFVIENSEAITSKMYDILFTENPEIMHLFVDSDDTQHVKLAMALNTVAANIEHLDRLEETLEKIAASHVRVGVQPEQYPFVGKALLEAIKRVLGSAASNDVMKAWEELYSLLAGALIAREKALYEAG